MEKKTGKDYTWISSSYYYLEEERISLGEKMNSPLLDLYETDGEVIIEVDVPGIDPRHLDVKIANNQLTIEGKRGLREEEGVNYLRMERCHEDFRRITELPIAVNSHKVKARYERGVLIVLFPKIEEKRKEKIVITVG